MFFLGKGSSFLSDVTGSPFKRFHTVVTHTDATQCGHVAISFSSTSTDPFYMYVFVTNAWKLAHLSQPATLKHQT